MQRSWSTDAGAPAIPAALALAGGILAAVSLPVPPPPEALAALVFLPVCYLAVFLASPEHWGQEIAIWWKQNRSSGFLLKGDRMRVGHSSI